jgi:DNA sulfur modification protein DndB
MFTLSGIHHATQSLLQGLSLADVDEKVALAADFWNEVATNIPDWHAAKERRLSAADLRRDFIHAHALGLAAIARAGNAILQKDRKNWRGPLRRLKTLDWSRTSNELWEGRAMSAGRLSKRSVNVTLTGNAIKHHLGLDLTPEEQQIENAFVRSSHGRRSRT